MINCDRATGNHYLLALWTSSGAFKQRNWPSVNSRQMRCAPRANGLTCMSFVNGPFHPRYFKPCTTGVNTLARATVWERDKVNLCPR
jgi:hypothetical protein